MHVALQKGCLVFKDDKDQWLCEHHYTRMSPQGGWWLLEDRFQPDMVDGAPPGLLHGQRETTPRISE